MARLDVAGVNVPRKVGRRNWRNCFARAFNRSDVAGFNEILTKPQERVLLAEVERRGLAQYGARVGPNPIVWDPTIYRRVSSRQIRFHGPGTGMLARRYPGYNSARSGTEVVLRRRDGVGPDIAVLNVHLVPNGRKVSPRWRRRVRAASLVHLRGIVAGHHAAGRIVVLLGDTNIRKPFRVHPDWRWLRGRGIDKVGVLVPGSVRITSAHATRFPAPTDHKRGIAAGITYKETR